MTRTIQIFDIQGAQEPEHKESSLQKADIYHNHRLRLTFEVRRPSPSLLDFRGRCVVQGEVQPKRQSETLQC